MLWSLEPGCGLVQHAPARTGGCLAPCPALLRTGQGRGWCAGPRSPCGLIGSTRLRYINTHVQRLSFVWSPWRAAWLLWDSLVTRAVGGSLPPAGIQSLAPTEPWWLRAEGARCGPVHPACWSWASMCSVRWFMWPEDGPNLDQGLARARGGR